MQDLNLTGCLLLESLAAALHNVVQGLRPRGEIFLRRRSVDVLVPIHANEVALGEEATALKDLPDLVHEWISRIEAADTQHVRTLLAFADGGHDPLDDLALRDRRRGDIGLELDLVRVGEMEGRRFEQSGRILGADGNAQALQALGSADRECLQARPGIEAIVLEVPVPSLAAEELGAFLIVDQPENRFRRCLEALIALDRHRLGPLSGRLPAR